MNLIYNNTQNDEIEYAAPTIVYEGHVGVRAGSFTLDPANPDGTDPGIADPSDLFGNNN